MPTVSCLELFEGGRTLATACACGMCICASVRVEQKHAASSCNAIYFYELLQTCCGVAVDC